MASDKFEEVLLDVCKLFSIECLKEEQKTLVKSMLAKRNCIAVLPTGFGKTLPYQILLPLPRWSVDKDWNEFCFHAESKIIVCSPLVALMEDQVKRLDKIDCLRVLYKGRSKDVDERILSGDFDILFASPETLVGNHDFRKQLQKCNIGVIVIDEFHTIYEWGGEVKVHESVAFRKWFRYLGELRSLCPQANLLALSATCTKKIKNHVSEVLGLDPVQTTEVIICPNKSNIKLVVKKVDKDIEAAMYWLMESLNSFRKAFPRTLIYCNSISDVSKLYNYIVREIVECAKCIDMYHSETPDENKKLIVEALRTKSSEKRVILFTSALGMGIDVVECNSVILYGPPRNVVDLIQSIGRGGRDGEQSIAMIMYNSYQCRNVDQEIKSFISCKSCRRKNLMNNFMSDADLFQLEKDMNVHTCCDICVDMCKCNKSSLLQLEKVCSNEYVNSDISSGSNTVDYEYDISDDNRFSDNEICETFEACDVEECSL